MSDKVKMACEAEVRMLPLNCILPMRLLDAGIRASVKFKCIEASVKEIGLIEPLVVYPQPGSEILSIVVDEEFQAAASLGLIPSMN